MLLAARARPAIPALPWALLLAAVCALAIGAQGRALPSGLSSEAGELRAERDYAGLPLAFEPRAGRAGTRGAYVAHTAAGSIALDAGGATLAPQGAEAGSVGLRLIGALPAQLRTMERLPGVVNDLRGDRPQDWRTGIPTFARVRYQGVYPGIDIDWHGSGGRLEYDFRLAPHADPGRIAIRIAGAKDARLTSAGDLVIERRGATIRQSAPIAYQRSATGRSPVEASFTLRGDRVGFELGAYDRTRPLVIDPVFLGYSTYLGGSADDVATGVAVDSSGAAYLTGGTDSSDFDLVGGLPGGDPSVGPDVFVSKLNPAGNALVYSTYLGGSSVDHGEAIAVDGSGAAYITGFTASANFPTAGPQLNVGESDDVFITKLNPAGNGLAYSTYLGGDLSDFGESIAVDFLGAAYVAGETDSSDFPSVGSGVDGDEGGIDGFVAKVVPGGGALSYSTYLGGNAYDSVRGIAVDAGGTAYVSGGTESTDFDTVAPIQGDSASFDGFAAKLNGAGDALAYSTYLGGSGFDFSYALAVDSTGAAYVTGDTASGDFPTVGAIEGDSPATDAFVSKIAPAGGSLAYSTYLGGDGGDFSSAIAVDAAGAAYVAGGTESTDFNLVDPIDGDSGGTDFFASKLEPGGALGYSTYVGGSGDDNAHAIAVDVTGAAYLAGESASGDFDTLGPVEGDQGAGDAVITKLAQPSTATGDTDPPETEITKKPKRKVKTKRRKVRAKLKFRSDEPGSSFECKLDKRKYKPCDSPFKKKVRKGKHKFRVRAIDPAGNVDPTPDKAKWKVKRRR